MPAEDTFKSQLRGLDSPFEDCFAISPSDTDDLDRVTRGIYVGSDGDLCVTMLSGTTMTYRNVVGGAIYPWRIARVHQTGTTASELIGTL